MVEGPVLEHQDHDVLHLVELVGHLSASFALAPSRVREMIPAAVNERRRFARP